MSSASTVKVSLKKSSCQPKCGGRLQKINPAYRLDWEVTDVPGHDTGGFEADPAYVDLTVRPPGSETDYLIEEGYGGRIHTNQAELSSVVDIEKWIHDHYSDVAQEEMKLGRAAPPSKDGSYTFFAWVMDSNGKISRPSNGITLKLSITPSDPAEFTLAPSSHVDECN